MTALFVSFLFVVVLCVVGGLVVLASRNGRHRLIASAPPGALVGADDTSAEAQAKLAQYRSTLEAARLLQALLVKDDAALFLTVEERRDIKAWLENFYGRGPS
jgi:hypothetical protein